MALSIPIPIAIAAIVIVIISRGILNNPIIPKIIRDGMVFDKTAIRAIEADLKININMMKIITKTLAIVLIWELNRL